MKSSTRIILFEIKELSQNDFEIIKEATLFIIRNKICTKKKFITNTNKYVKNKKKED